MSSARPSSTKRPAKSFTRARPLPHFNEVDECAGLDALVTNRLWSSSAMPPETTLHDLRWGRQYTARAWMPMSGSLRFPGPSRPRTLTDGYKGATSERQPPMYFRAGRRHRQRHQQARPDRLEPRFCRRRRAQSSTPAWPKSSPCPQAETQDRWDQTTPQWPIMHAVLKGITRDQMMARHKANHIQVAYAPDLDAARHALYAKAAAMHALGLDVNLCGEI